MPFALLSTIAVELLFQDDGGSTAPVVWYIPRNQAGSSTQTALGFAAAAAARCGAISSAAIPSARIVLSAFDLSAAAPTQADVVEAAVFIFVSAAGRLFAVTVPSFDPALYVTIGPWAGIAVDLTKPTVQALITLLIEGNSTIRPADHAGSPLIRLKTAYRQYRNVVTVLEAG